MYTDTHVLCVKEMDELSVSFEIFYLSCSSHGSKIPSDRASMIILYSVNPIISQYLHNLLVTLLFHVCAGVAGP